MKDSETKKREAAWQGVRLLNIAAELLNHKPVYQTATHGTRRRY
jgi:hypothetical protein